MKPDNWDKLSQIKKRRIGDELFQSLRGMFIMHQALKVAIESMKKQTDPEISDIEDMEMLLQTVFYMR